MQGVANGLKSGVRQRNSLKCWKLKIDKGLRKHSDGGQRQNRQFFEVFKHQEFSWD